MSAYINLNRFINSKKNILMIKIVILPEPGPGPELGTPCGGEDWGWEEEEWGLECVWEEVITEISFSFSVENPESATVEPGRQIDESKKNLIKFMFLIHNQL